MMKVTNKQRAQEVQVDNCRVQQAEQAAYQDIQEKQNNKLVPIIGKARKAIDEVAKAKQIFAKVYKPICLSFFMTTNTPNFWSQPTLYPFQWA